MYIENMKDINSSYYINANYLIDYFNNQIRKKKGGGRDHLTPEKFWARYEGEIGDIASKCLQGQYKFSLYNEKLVLKGRDKKPRVLSIPSIKDRLVLGVLNDYLSAVFEDCIHRDVPNVIIDRIKLYLKVQKGSTYFLRTDFTDFYGTIDISVLMSKLSERIIDQNILNLLFTAITTPTASDSNYKSIKKSKSKGIPQGLAISNILAAIYLKSFDEDCGVKVSDLYLRYVDDILFLDSKTNEHLLDILKNEITKKNLALSFSEEKCKAGIIGKEPLDFLGYSIGHKIFIQKKNVTSFISRVASLASRCIEEYNHEYKRPLFIREDTSFFKFYIEEFNMMLSGFKVDRHLYGWLPYYQSITDVASLYGLDRVVRYRILKGIPEEICSNIHSLVDTYYSIHKKSGGNLVKDLDELVTIDEKKHFLAHMGRLDKNKLYSDNQIIEYFNNYIDFIKKRSMQNIGEQS